jgi:hypothetical protein
MNFQDKKGYIGAGDLKSVLGQTKDYSESVWRSLIAEIDSNKDGVVSKFSF